LTTSPLPLPVLPHAEVLGWPKHNDAPEIGYVDAAEAFTRTWPSDAHFAAYSVPGVRRRLTLDAVGGLAGGWPMVLFVVDVDGPGHKRTPEWWADEQTKIAALLAAHPGGFVYATRGGYRLVYALASPFVVRTIDDKEAWRLRYRRELLYLARRWGIVGDPACADITRLYRLPYVVRDGAPSAPELLGDPAALGAWGHEPSADELPDDTSMAQTLATLDPKAWRPVLRTLTPEGGGQGGEAAPELQHEDQDEERLHKRAAAYLAAMAPSIDGAGGNAALWAAALAMVRGFNLGAETGAVIIERDFNPRCRPAWDRAEIRRTCRNAADRGEQAWGYLRDAEGGEKGLNHKPSQRRQQHQRPRPADHSTTTEGASMPDPTTDEHHQGDELPAPFLPLATSHDLPAFPLGALPDVVGRYVHQLAEHLEVPVDLPATLALGVLASVCMRRFVVQPRPGWTETTNLYLVAALDPGERKTPAFRKVLGPLYAIQKERVETWKKLCKDLAKQRSEEREDKAGKEAKKLEPLPPRPRLFVDDATPEKLAMVLLEQGERITLASDEGGVFQMMTGLYSKSGQANTGVYLKSHDGGQYTVDRMSREALHLEAPAMTMALAVQPEVIRALAKRPDLRGIGLWARFCYCMPASRVGSRTYDAPDVETDVRDHWHQLVKDLDSRARALNEGREEPVTVMFSPEAWRRLHAAVVAIDRAMLPGAVLASVRDWASKLGGLIVRLAGLLHLAEVDEPEKWTVDADTVERAIDLGRYFLAHARHVFDVEMSLDPAEQAARQAWAAIERRGATRVTPADVGRWVKSLRKSPDALAALGVLCERGYVDLDRHHKGKGRVYLVKVTPSHPKATKVTQKSDLISEPYSQENAKESEGKAPQAGEALHASPPWPTPGDLGDLGDFPSPEAKSASVRPMSAGDMPGDLPGDFRGPGSSNEPTTTPPPVSGVATAPAANDPGPAAELEVLDVIDLPEAEGAEE